jgi:hypothetical protein
MKAIRPTALMISVLIFLTASFVFAQQDTSIAVLKEQITQLEEAERRADLPGPTRASTMKLLTEKRIRLRATIWMQIESLRKYQASYGSRFTLKESQNVASSIQRLESELQNLAGGSGAYSSAESQLQEKGHADKLRGVSVVEKRIRSEQFVTPRSVTPKTPAENSRPREFTVPESRFSTRSAASDVNVTPVRALRPAGNAFLAAADPAPAEAVGIPVYWDSSRSAPACPAAVTERTTVKFHLTGINDLLMDFGHNTRIVYRLTTKKYSRSQAPPANLFFKQSGRRIVAPRIGGDCGISDERSLIQTLNSIGQQADQVPEINPSYSGGSSIPVAETADAARSIPEVSCVLGLLAENPDNPIFTNRVKTNPVFLWIMRIAGPHAMDLSVEVEPDYNYDFKIEEIWKGRVTEGGTIKASCGEKDLFTLSVGPIVSTLPSRTYTHQKALVPAGSSTTQDVLSVGNTRNINVLGAALINYHLPRFSWLPSETGLALSAGPVYTLGSKPEVSALGLFLGLSVHLNRSIFITPGIHIGEFADFPTGFVPGTVIPDQFGDLNPVKRRTAHFAIGLTYKTASFKKEGNAAAPAEDTGNGGGGDDQTPAGSPGTPGTDTPGTPGTGNPEGPDTDTPETPETHSPETPTLNPSNSSMPVHRNTPTSGPLGLANTNPRGTPASRRRP